MTRSALYYNDREEDEEDEEEEEGLTGVTEFPAT